MIESKKPTSYASTMLISRLAPIAPNGLREDGSADDQGQRRQHGQVQQYDHSLRRNPACGSISARKTIADANAAPAIEINGAAMNPIELPPFGTTIFLLISLPISAKGWYQGGPIRLCTTAVTLRSTQVNSKPTTAVNRKPGKIKV